jgi:hypothetical protein
LTRASLSSSTARTFMDGWVKPGQARPTGMGKNRR